MEWLFILIKKLLLLSQIKTYKKDSTSKSEVFLVALVKATFGRLCHGLVQSSVQNDFVHPHLTHKKIGDFPFVVVGSTPSVNEEPPNVVIIAFAGAPASKLDAETEELFVDSFTCCFVHEADFHNGYNLPINLV